MPKLAQAGDFCPNEACDDYGKLQSDQPQPNIIKYGQTKQGKQRYKCHTCGATFSETKGTIFYRRRTPAHEITDTLALLAEGNRISSLRRAKGHKADTILAWLRAAGEHAEAVEAILLADYQLERGQIDGLWAYVGNKGEKKTIRRQHKAVNSGVSP